MKILLVNYEYPPLGGGGGIANRDIAEALAQRHEVHVVTTHYPGIPHDEVLRGVHLHRVRVWGRTALPTATLRSMVTFTPVAVRVGIRLLNTFRPDVIHAFFAVPSGVPAAIIRRRTRLPFVVTLVGADVFDPNPTAGVSTHRHPAARAVIRWVIRSADAVTAISEDTKRRAVQYHEAPASTRVIPLGFVPPRVLPPRAEPKPPGFHLITVGRLIPRKGYPELLEALAELPSPGVKLTVVGDGPLKPALAALAARLGITDRVVFAGAIDEDRKWALLRSADAYVSASVYEGFGVVFLEAMCAGLPIVTTDVGGHTDFLLQGENALLVPPGQPRQLAAALRVLLRDDGLCARLAAANRQKISAFRIDHAAALYEDVFHEVMAADRHGGEPRGVPMKASTTELPP